MRGVVDSCVYSLTLTLSRRERGFLKVPFIIERGVGTADLPFQRLLLRAAPPELGVARGVQYANHNNALSLLDVKHSVRESAQESAPDIAIDSLVPVGIFDDGGERSIQG